MTKVFNLVCKECFESTRHSVVIPYGQKFNEEPLDFCSFCSKCQSFTSLIFKPEVFRQGSQTLMENKSGLIKTSTRRKGSSGMHYSIVRSGDVIFNEGDLSDKIYIIKVGQFSISKLSSSGKKEVLDILSDNDIFGEIGVITGTPRSATVTALEPEELYFITKEQFETFLIEKPEFLRPFFLAMADRLKGKPPVIDSSLVFTKIKKQIEPSTK
ncbi:MAG: cyclic nucleotide-binding domain-containing protein [Nitrospina sp.]|nr:cyclic nucleotide-binding domain-containing protein [Nitrospina sp.]